MNLESRGVNTDTKSEGLLKELYNRVNMVPPLIWPRPFNVSILSSIQGRTVPTTVVRPRYKLINDIERPGHTPQEKRVYLNPNVANPLLPSFPYLPDSLSINKNLEVFGERGCGVRGYQSPSSFI